ncbi:MAG: hypothetical protein V4720_03285 [Pseudomonadota bacterium]
MKVAVRYRTAFVALMFAVLALSSCTSETTWNQRLTLIVETPQGEVRGSAVTRVTKTETSGSLVLMEARGVQSKVEGEAVVVEVAPGKFLFALLSGTNEEKRDATHWVYPAYQLGEASSFGGEMMKLQSQPHDTPVPLPPEGWPMLVTFDDITKPESVREVDPDDLDATFGCAKTTHVLPWRKEGVKYREWADSERSRLWREKIAERAGLTGPAAKALIELYEIVDAHRYLPADKARGIELRKLFSADEEERWDAARRSMLREDLPTVPTSETLAEMAGGQCYRIMAVTLEITEEVVTEGRVEGVLGWWPQMREGPRNGMPSLKLPNQSPRGWDHLDPLQFWSLDRVLEINGRSE